MLYASVAASVGLLARTLISRFTEYFSDFAQVSYRPPSWPARTDARGARPMAGDRW